jgi:hypothetical protein
MKKLLGMMLIGLLCLTTFASCKKEVVEPTPKSTTELNGVWVIQEQGIIVDIQGTDTTWTEGFYQGDGNCCNVQTVSITNTEFEIGTQVQVGNDMYHVVDLNETGYGIAGDGEPQIYRYWIALVINTPYVGCVNDMVLGKRITD